MKKDILKISGVNFISQFFGFLFTTYLSSYFTPEIFGRFYLILSIQLIITLLVEGGVNTKFITRLAKKEITEGQIFNVLFGRVVISTLLITVFVLISRILAKFYISNLETLAVIVGVFGWILFSSANLYFQATRRFDALGVSLVSTALLKILGLVLILKLTKHIYESALFIFFLAPFFSGIIFIIFIALKTEFKLGFKKYYELARDSKYIFLSVVFITMIMRCDVFMIQLMANEMDLGYYSIPSNLTNVLPPISLAISTVILPQINLLLKDDNKETYKKKILALVPYWILFLIFGISGGLIFIQLIYSENVEIISRVFGLLFLSFSLSILVNPIGLIYYDTNREYILTKINFFQLLGNIVLNILLIPLLGAIGAALSTLVIKLTGSYFIIKNA